MSAVLTPHTPKLALEPLPRRRFGKTAERVPLIGLGTGPGGLGLPDAEAIPIYEAAINLGVTYLDTAPGYNRAHVQLGQILPARRDEVFLVTKACTGSAKEALAIHEQSLKDLKVESVDLLYAHGIGSFEPEQLLAPDGVFAGLMEAKRRGWTRYIGFTAHHYPWKSEFLLNEALKGNLELDAVMLAMNFADRHTYGFERRVLPLAEKLDLGVAVMKVYGGAHEMKYEVNRHSQLKHGHHSAFRYALGLPGTSLAVIGMNSVEEVERNVAWVRNWEPLTGEEAERLDAEGATLAAEWGPHFGEVE
jgi:predicted aldo/keto reductase-like oxidoreductase